MDKVTALENLDENGQISQSTGTDMDTANTGSKMDKVRALDLNRTKSKHCI